MASSSSIDAKAVATIRGLSIDAVQAANSGHPGAPLGMAPAAHVLWSKAMSFNPSNPKWANRDRFVLSNGHACALLYSMLHLSGYEDVPVEQLRQFRQLHSKTPGHPESCDTAGVEVTTGPLGQGIANGVGIALAERHLAAAYNTDAHTVVDHATYVFCGDGCLQEGVASEAASLAGHWQLGKLIVVYDDNEITIDGPTSLSFSEDVAARFRAYGWQTLAVANGNDDLDAIAAALAEAKADTARPTLISLKTTIGFGSSKAGTHGVHGSPLGPDGVRETKATLGLNPDESFHVPADVAALYAARAAQGAAAEAAWQTTFDAFAAANPAKAAAFTRITANAAKPVLPAGWKDALPAYKPGDKPDATRNISGAVLNALADAIPEIVGGSADLTPSNKTDIKSSHDYMAHSPAGRYIRFGVREFGMFAIANGIQTSGLLPYTATFLNFLTYGWGAVRLAALAHYRQLFVMTHDSIGLGEDGPTHQPIEVLSVCRATPNLYTFRPADGTETVGSYVAALERETKGPAVVALSRQNLPQLDGSSLDGVSKGAYVVLAAENPQVVIIATGSEVEQAILAAKELSGDLRVSVVSAPCLELFDAQPVAYRRSVLPVGVPVVSVEAAAPTGWAQYAHFSVAMRTFGASGKAEDLYEHFGFSAGKIAASVRGYVAQAGELAVGALPTHYE